MQRTERQRRAENPDAKSGRVLVRILVPMLTIGAIVAALLFAMLQVRNTIVCSEHLRTIYRALELYEMERGALPNLAYFPDEPTEDNDSLRVVLEPYGLSSDRCICPAAHPIQINEGLTYLWNPALNSQRIPREGEPVWMVVDMNALSGDVPAPHLGRYNALFSDGTVKRIHDPRSELPGL